MREGQRRREKSKGLTEITRQLTFNDKLKSFPQKTRSFVSTYNLPIKRSPEKGTRSWCEEGTELVRTRYEGSGAPLSIDKGKEKTYSLD